MAVCSRDPSHVYPGHNKKCPWCAAAASTAPAPKQVKLPPVQAPSGAARPAPRTSPSPTTGYRPAATRLGARVSTPRLTAGIIFLTVLAGVYGSHRGFTPTGDLYAVKDSIIWCGLWAAIAVALSWISRWLAGGLHSNSAVTAACAGCLFGFVIWLMCLREFYTTVASWVTAPACGAAAYSIVRTTQSWNTRKRAALVAVPLTLFAIGISSYNLGHRFATNLFGTVLEDNILANLTQDMVYKAFSLIESWYFR